MNQCISLHCNESGEKSIVRLKLCMVVHTQQMRFESNEYPFPTFACFFFFKSPMIQPENVAFFFLARRFDLFFFFSNLNINVEVQEKLSPTNLIFCIVCLSSDT